MAKSKKRSDSLKKPREKSRKRLLDTDIDTAPLPDLQGRAAPGDRQAENIIDTIEME